MRISRARTARLSVSLLLAVVAGFLFHRYGPDEFSRVQTIASALASVAGLLFGLTLTAASLLLSGTGKRLISNMQVTGHFRHLAQALMHTALLWMVALLACVAVLFVNPESAHAALAVAVGLSVLALVNTLSSGRKMAVVLLYWGSD